MSDDAEKTIEIGNESKCTSSSAWSLTCEQVLGVGAECRVPHPAVVVEHQRPVQNEVRRLPQFRHRVSGRRDEEARVGAELAPQRVPLVGLYFLLRVEDTQLLVPARRQAPDVAIALVVHRRHELAVRADGDVLHGRVHLGHALLLRVRLHVPQVDAAVVGADGHLDLVRVQRDGVYRRLTVERALTDLRLHVPDAHAAVLAAGEHPLAVLLEADAGYVLGDALEVHHRSVRYHVVEPDVLVAARDNHRLVRRDVERIHLLQVQKHSDYLVRRFGSRLLTESACCMLRTQSLVSTFHCLIV